MSSELHDPFVSFRGEFPTKALTARRVAGLLDAPGCNRRAVLDAASVDIEKLAVLLGGPHDRQSPFAISRGNQFEERVMSDHWSPLIALIREHLGFDIPEVRMIDLSSATIREQFRTTNQSLIQARRHKLTRNAVEEMLVGSADAYNLIRHPLTNLRVGGSTAWLEQDVLAFCIKGRLFVVEIKSFPSIDGQPDPDKVSTALRQTAVYLLSMQTLASELGFSVDSVSTNVLLVMPNNLSFVPVGKVQDVAMQIARLRRQIDSVPDAVRLIDGLDSGIGLPTLPAKGANEDVIEAARVAARDAISAITAKFGDACSSCPLFSECRTEVERRGLTSRLGNDLANTCGSVTTIDRALAIAEGRQTPHGEAEQALADVLRRGAAAADLHRATG